jgi:hypothetical protein
MTYRTVVNPDNDAEFVAEVGRVATPDLVYPQQLETALRDGYPEVQVRNGVRDADGRERWYVYRDGRWTSR